jgi:predicted dithiol-disulfide oxidoreductase (DUF899 family)
LQSERLFPEAAQAFGVRAALGRNETGMWWRRHDEYNSL